MDDSSLKDWMMEQGAREKVDPGELALCLESHFEAFKRCRSLGVPMWMCVAMCRMNSGEGPFWPTPKIVMTPIGEQAACLGLWLFWRLASTRPQHLVH